MGTDIHGVFQRHDGDKWIDVQSSYEFDRHYQLFAVLAGVRNGFGFAGVVTGEVVTPIADPRGLPEDFEVVDYDYHPSPFGSHEHEDLIVQCIWMGSHSHSWLGSDEMLAWYDRAPVVVKQGVLDREVYEAWDKESPPPGWSGDVLGPQVVKISEPEIGRTDAQWTHVLCTWESPLRKELAYFFDEVRRLRDLHSGVRFVFGFDS